MLWISVSSSTRYNVDLVILLVAFLCGRGLDVSISNGGLLSRLLVYSINLITVVQILHYLRETVRSFSPSLSVFVHMNECECE